DLWSCLEIDSESRLRSVGKREQQSSVSGGASPDRLTFPDQARADREFSRVRAKHTHRPARIRKENPMTRQGTTLVSVLFLRGAALIASCAKSYHEENERYVFVATNINLPYWQEAQAGFLDAARALGVKAELVGPATYDPDAEVGVFRQVVEQQPAGI